MNDMRVMRICAVLVGTRCLIRSVTWIAEGHTAVPTAGSWNAQGAFASSVYRTLLSVVIQPYARSLHVVSAAP